MSAESAVLLLMDKKVGKNFEKKNLKKNFHPQKTKCSPSIVITLPFPWENAVEMTVGNPIPWGRRKRWSIFFSENLTKMLNFFGFWRVSRHPHPRAQFSKSPPRPRQIKGPELRPAASTLGLWNASWPGLWLWKLCPGAGVSAVQQMCGGVSDGRWLTKKWWSIGFIVRFKFVCMYTCIVEIKCLKILFNECLQFIKFLKLFHYSGEKVGRMGSKKGEMPFFFSNLTQLFFQT